jgi:hypothetical protein
MTTQAKAISPPGRALAPAAPTAPTGNQLGAPVLQLGEDPDLYDRLHARVTAAVKPRDVIEEFWVRDVVDLAWETLSLRRLKALYLAVSASAGLYQVIRPLVGSGRASDLAEQWFARKDKAVQEVEQALTQAGLTMEAVTAETLVLKMASIERIDRLIMNAEARRNAVLREVERHRDVLAARLSRAAEDIEDGEFSEIENPPERA